MTTKDKRGPGRFRPPEKRSTAQQLTVLLLGAIALLAFLLI